MGRSVKYFSYPENIDKEKVNVELRACTNGELDCIRWLDNEAASDEDEAKRLIEDNDSGWYDCLAVRYFATPTQAGDIASELYKRLEEQLLSVIKKYTTMKDKLFFEGLKSLSATCKNCRSRLTVAYLKSNECPVCGTDMRSETTQKRLAGYKKKMASLFNQMEAEKVRHNSKAATKTDISQIFWLVKIEYHTD